MTRRGLLGSLLALPAAYRAPRETEPQQQVQVWDVVPCPGCGRQVCFLPDQRRNRCAWCGTGVRHGMGI